MPIGKRPGAATNEVTPERERAEQRVISGATHQPPEREKVQRQQVLLRLDPDMLKRIDEQAKQHGLNRQSWMIYLLSEGLDQEAQR